jgi:hypothetical protein
MSAVPACGPDTRTMEIALGGRPDDSAKMVCSRGCIAYLSPSPLKTQRNFRQPTISCGQGRSRRIAAGTARFSAALMLQKSTDLSDLLMPKD